MSKREIFRNAVHELILQAKNFKSQKFATESGTALMVTLGRHFAVSATVTRSGNESRRKSFENVCAPAFEFGFVV